MLRGFLDALTRGDATGMMKMLEQDVVAYSDGGGKVRAALNPIYGADRVTRFLLGIMSRPEAQQFGGFFTEVNGQPAYVTTIDGQPNGVFSIDLGEGGRIRRMFIIVNPDKLIALRK
jgi:RNA polymerase sigma-70 factor (ECF subfamily)